MQIRVRQATAEDIPWLVIELKKFADFFGTRLSLFNEEYAPLGLAGLIENHCFYIADKEDVGPVGFITGILQRHPFNPKIMALTEVFWWVAEEHRMSRAALMLFNKFVEFGKANADWINFSLETASPVKDNFMLKHGFRLQERSFMYEVN